MSTVCWQSWCPDMPGVYTVRQVNAYIKNMFVQDYVLNRIQIKGEVSGCKYHTSGHIYFTLKDDTGTLACVMFASSRKGLAFPLKNGQQVIAEGSIRVYERDGKYQLYTSRIVLDGIGDLYRQFEELKRTLEEMGMFDACYKKPIPKYSKTIGVVTASTGAAIHDIMNIAVRRNPYVQLVLCPALVQGESAPASIVRGIETLDAMGLDVLIVGRGGGSIEDLWAFNEEVVARAIFECETPVISAVGHEVDVTIADFVADMRAPTPSAAAELAVFDYRQFIEDLSVMAGRLNHCMTVTLRQYQAQVEQYRLRLQGQHPGNLLFQEKQYLADLEERLERAMEGQKKDARHELALLAERLSGLSPLSRLTGGYGYVSTEDGPVNTIGQVEEGSAITIRIWDGTVTAQVTGKEEMVHGENN